jgi:hypothetical protein
MVLVLLVIRLRAATVGGIAQSERRPSRIPEPRLFADRPAVVEHAGDGRDGHVRLAGDVLYSCHRNQQAAPTAVPCDEPPSTESVIVYMVASRLSIAPLRLTRCLDGLGGEPKAV